MNRGLLWSLVSTICSGVGSILVTPILVKTLGAATFGIYILMLTMTAYAGFFDLGLTWAAGRYFAEDFATSATARLTTRFHTLARFLAGVGALSLVVAICLGPLLLRLAGVERDADIVLPLLLAALSFTLTLQVGLSGSLLRACQRFEDAGRIQAVGSVLLPAASYAMVRASGTLTALLVVNVLVNGVGLLLSLMVVQRQFVPIGRAQKWQPSHLREMVGFGGWSSLSRVLMIFMLQVDRLAVALLGSVSGLTYYAVSANLASRVNLLGGPMASMFFTRASMLYARGNEQELARQHAMAKRFMTWTATAAAAPLILLGHDFLRVWISDAMAENGSPVLAALGIGYAVIAVASIDGVTIEGAGRPDLAGKVMLVWSALAIASVVVFAPRLGASAVGYAVGGWLVGVGLTDMVVARHVVLQPLREGESGIRVIGLLASLGAAFLSASLGRSLIGSVASALLLMALVGTVTLVVGFFATLIRADRALLIGKVRGFIPASVLPASQPGV